MRYFLICFFFFCSLFSFGQTVVLTSATSCGDGNLPPFCESVQFRAPAFLNSSFLVGEFTWTLEQRLLTSTNKEDTTGIAGFEKVTNFDLGTGSTSAEIPGYLFVGKQLRVKVSRGGFESQYFQNFYIYPELISADCEGTLDTSKDNMGLTYSSGIDVCRGAYIDVIFGDKSYFIGDRNFNLVSYQKRGEGWYTIEPGGIGVNANGELIVGYNGILQIKGGLTDYCQVIDDTLRIYGSNTAGNLYWKGAEANKMYIQIFPQGRDKEIYNIEANRCSNPVLRTFPSSDTTTFSIAVEGESGGNIIKEASYHGEKFTFDVTLSGGGFSGGSGTLAYSFETSASDSIIITPKSEGHYEVEIQSPLGYADNVCSQETIERTLSFKSCASGNKKLGDVTFKISSPPCPGFSTEVKPISSGQAFGEITPSFSNLPNGVSPNIEVSTYPTECDELTQENGVFSNLVPGFYKLNGQVVGNENKVLYSISEQTIDIDSVENSAIQLSSMPESYYGSGDGTLKITGHEENYNHRLEYTEGGEKQFTKPNMNGVFSWPLASHDATNFTVLEYAGYCEENNRFTRYKSFNNIPYSSLSPMQFGGISTNDVTVYDSADFHYQKKITGNISGGSGAYYITAFYKDEDNSTNWQLLPKEQSILSSSGAFEFSNGLPVSTSLFVVALDLGGVTKWATGDKDNFTVNLTNSEIDDFYSNPNAQEGYVKILTEGGVTQDFNFQNPAPYQIDPDKIAIKVGEDDRQGKPAHVICKGGSIDLSFSELTSDRDYASTEYGWFALQTGEDFPTDENPYIHTINKVNEANTINLVAGKYPAGKYFIYLSEDTDSWPDYKGYQLAIADIERDTVIITEPKDPISIISHSYSVYNSQENATDVYKISRFEGKDNVEFNITGGISPYTSVQFKNSIEAQYSDDVWKANGFLADDSPYYLSLIDNNGCSTTVGDTTFTFNQPAELILSLDSSHYGLGYHISKSGGNDGSITLKAKNGIPNYTYELYKVGDLENPKVVSNKSEEVTFDELTAGTYYAVAYDRYYDKNDYYSGLDEEDAPSFEDWKKLWEDDEDTKGDIVFQQITLLEPEEFKIESFSVHNYGAHLGEHYHVQAAAGKLAHKGKINFTIVGGIPKVDGGGKLYYDITATDGEGSSTSMELKVEDKGIGNSPRFQVASMMEDFSKGDLTFMVSEEIYDQDTTFNLLAPAAIQISFLVPQKPSCLGEKDGQLFFDIEGGIPKVDADGRYYEVAVGGGAVNAKIYQGKGQVLKKTSGVVYLLGQNQSSLVFMDSVSAPYGSVDYTSYEKAWLNLAGHQPWPSWAANDGPYVALQKAWDDQDKKWNEHSASLLPYIMPNHPPVQLLAHTYSTICDDSKDGEIRVAAIYGGKSGDYTLYFNGNAEGDAFEDTLTYAQNKADDYTFAVNYEGCGSKEEVNYTVSKVFDGLTKEVLGDTIKTASNAINIPATAPIITDVIVKDFSCFSEASGQLSLNKVQGGHAPYLLTIDRQNNTDKSQWDHVESPQFSVSQWQSTADLDSGTYALTLVDKQGCYLKKADGTPVADARIERLINNAPTAHFAQAIGYDASCAENDDGRIVLNNFNLVKPTTLIWKDIHGAEVTSSSLVVGDKHYEAAHFPAGTYQLWIQEENCSERRVAINPVTIGTAPAVAWVDTLSVHGNICEGFSVIGEVNVTGGNIWLGSLSSTNDTTWADLGKWGTENSRVIDTGLSPARYIFKYVQTAGCNEVLSEEVNLTDPQYSFALELKQGSFEVDCFGASTPLIFGPIVNDHAKDIKAYELYDNSNQFINSSTDGQFDLPVGSYVLRAYFEPKTACPVYSEDYTFEVTAPAPLVLSDLTTNEVAACAADAKGIISGRIAGGTAPYVLHYKIGVTDQQQKIEQAGDFKVENLPVGQAYQLQLKDANGCATALSAVINLPFKATEASLTATAEDYCNTKSGAALLEITEGTGPFYLYLDGKEVTRFSEKTLDLTELTAGEYTYELMDVGAGECRLPLPLTIAAAPKSFMAEVVLTNAPACGGEDGAIQIELKNTADQPLDWSDFNLLNAPAGFDAATGQIKDLPAGNYHFEIQEKASEGCSVTLDYALVAQGTPSVTLAEVVDLPFCDQPNGVVRMTVSGGTGAYEWKAIDGLTLISSTADEFIIGGLKAHQNYGLQFRDQTGECYGQASVLIQQQQQGHIFGELSSQISPSSCGQAIGSIELPDLDEGIYSATWLRDQSTGNTLSHLAKGSYGVQLLHLSTGCDTTYWFEVGEREAVQISLLDQQPSDCGKATGSISVSATGGGDDFTYAWYKDNFLMNETSATLSGIFAGDYQVAAVDQYGCESGRLNVQINDRAALEVVLDVQALPSCAAIADGRARALVQGGLPPYQYEWNDVTGVTTTDQLTVGMNTLIVTDAAGCQQVANEQVNPVTAMRFDLNQGDPSCETAADGSAAVVLLNRNWTDIQSVVWKNAAGEIVASGESFDGFAYGNYVVEITEESGCVASSEFGLNFPAALQITGIESTAPSCPEATDGEAFVHVIGGSGQYNFEWYDELNALVGTNFFLENVPSGEYKVKVMDQKSAACFEEQIFEIDAPAPLTITQIEKIAPSCFGVKDGRISLTISGGQSPYLVQWPTINQSGWTATGLGIGTYEVVIEDQKGCQLKQPIIFDQQPSPLTVAIASVKDASCRYSLDGAVELEVSGGSPGYRVSWSNNQRGIYLDGVGQGNYMATVRDENQCQATLPVAVGAPALLISEILETTDPSCPGVADGTMLVKVAGGTAPFELTNLPADAIAVWNDANGYFEVSGLAAGQYQWRAKDANGCVATTGFERLTDPAPLSIQSVQYTMPNCYEGQDGAIAVEMTGGSGQYQFSWDNGQTSPQAIDLAAGSHAFTVTDALKGCEMSAELTLEQPTPLTVHLSGQDPLCHQDENGKLVAIAQGGTAGYYFQWEGQPAGAQVENLAAGTYAITVTDAHGCQVSDSYTLQDPAAVNFEIEGLTDPMEICDGTTLQLDAGAQWKTVQWVSEDRGLSFDSRQVSLTSSGYYEVHVTDQRDCPASLGFQLNLVDDLLAAEFLVESAPQEAFQTYVLVDITHPEPTSISWNIQPEVEVISEADHQQEIRFKESGEHVITLTSRQENCVATSVKVVEVVQLTNGRLAVDTGEGFPANEVVDGEHFTVTPNPNDGHFDISIQLSQIEDIYLSLQQVGEGKILWSKALKNKAYYHHSVAMPDLGTGVYVLHLMAPSGNQSLKFLIE